MIKRANPTVVYHGVNIGSGSYPCNVYMELDANGEFVLYEDHLAVVAEKDREIERLKETTIDVWIKVPKEDSDG
jgi:hypothetical protein